MVKSILNSHVSESHLSWLDGLRGIAAFWVLISHVQILSGLKNIPILSWGGLAVDLFMILSGFLMAHNYIHRQNSESWTSSSTFLVFWIRRFFRIAPLYYFLLFLAFFYGPILGDYRFAISEIWPNTATSPERYYDQSVSNIFSHLTFVFGFLPYFSYRTALPDWSIGLEMQFYMIFPFLMLVIYYLGWIKSSVLFVLTCVFIWFMFPNFIREFQMPTLLSLKLHVFLVGMWLAFSRFKCDMRRGLMISLIIMLIWIFIERNAASVARMLLVVLLYYFFDGERLPCGRYFDKSICAIKKIFSSSFGIFMGDTSYAVYLLHLLVVIPLAGELTKVPEYLLMSSFARFSLCLLLSVLIVYPLSWILHNTVEKWGIGWGKYFVGIYKSRKFKWSAL